MGFLEVVELSGLALTIKHSFWIYPSLETLHILGIALLVGPVVLMDLRILGFAAKRLSLDSLSWLATRLALVGFGLAVLSGSLMFTVQATQLAGTPLFLIKLLLIFSLLFNAVVIGRVMHTRLFQWLAIISLLGWVGVIGLGRWMAYV